MKAEQRYRDLFEALPIPIAISRASDFAVLLANPPLLELMRVPPGIDDLTQYHILDMLDGESLEKAKRNIAAIMAGDAPVGDSRYHLRRVDGTPLDAEIYSIPTRFAGGPAMFSIMLDVTRIQEAEAGRQAAEERYRQLLEALPVGVVYARLDDGAVTYANRAAVGIMRLDSASELVGKRVLSFVHPDDVEAVSAAVAVVRDGRRVTGPTRYRTLRGDGTIGMFEVFTLPSDRDAEGEVMILLIDNTERAAARVALAAAEERYRTLVEMSPDALLVHRDRRLIYVNPAGLRMLGAASPADVLGREIGEFIASGGGAPASAGERAMLEQGGPVGGVRIRMRRIDGSTLPAEISAVPIVFEGGPAMQTIARDMSQPEAERAARQEAESRARAIVESIPLGMHIYRLEEDGRLVFVEANAAAARIVPVDHEALKGMTIEEAFPALPESVREAYREVARTGVPWKDEALAYSQPGRIEGWFSVHVFRTAPNTITAAFEDMTESKQVADELAEYREHLERSVDERTLELTEANRALQEATRAKSAFLANMSHELRTPLNSIIGFSTLLGQGLSGPLTEEQQRQVTMINRSGRQLLALIGDVLDLEKIEAGRVEVRNDVFDVTRVAETVLETVRPMAVEKGLALRTDVSAAPRTMLADRHKIEQIMLNLLSNAIKYTENGSVMLRVRRLEDGMVAFSVEDTGIGIAPDEFEAIFEEFRQLPSRRAAKNPGTGLGLSISRHLAELMGGRIELASAVGAGSTFTLIVPDRPGR